MISEEQITAAKGLIADVANRLREKRDELEGLNGGEWDTTLSFINERQVSFNEPSSDLRQRFSKLNYLDNKRANLTVSLLDMIRQNAVDDKALLKSISEIVEEIEEDLPKV
ncbi:MAG: hypothetical protein COW03_13405 [Cytophagales bacterium CG12_big_fil_rev_8_21_14_0_65_40_12]|nr:MAG: hypothetical protein COW03_13405 [Cytophagales bacterium CG12_big_fil_rev_8_21_14_0_65_40_12]PIW03130.1 MAG: hypothetical protein COW40_17480 [Cytophagales bacterium CG17_big_fil_post_rev_8_21_14_2_50_40_13]